jgi:excisionase family DNA binding protein
LVVSTEARTITVEEAAARLGISRTHAYALARQGAIAGVPVIRLGKRMLVLREPLDRLLSGETGKAVCNADR